MIENQMMPIAAMLILLGVALYYGRLAGWPSRPRATVTLPEYKHWLSLGALLLIVVVNLAAWSLGHASHPPHAATAATTASTDTGQQGSGK